MKANYELTRIGIKLKTSLLLLLLFLAAVFQLQAQTIVATPGSHYCEVPGTGVTLGVADGSAVTYTLWKDNVITTESISGPSGTFSGLWTYGTYSLNGPVGWHVGTPLTVFQDVMPTTSTGTATEVTINCGETATIDAGGTGSTFNWYTGSCGGTLVSSSTTTSTLTVTPTTTTEYYGRWENTTCISNCVTVTVIVNPPAAPNVTSTHTAPVCSGSEVTIVTDYVGILEWFDDACDGNLVASTTTSLTVSPTATTTYYVRKAAIDGGCVAGVCTEVTITVDDMPTAPTTTTALPTTICSGSDVELSASGGTSHGGTLNWYSDAAGTNNIGTGSPITVSPTISGTSSATVTYYVRYENACNGAMASVTVTVLPVPISLTGATATPNPICSGYPLALAAQGYTATDGANVEWYSTSCGVGSEGDGVNLTVTPTNSGATTITITYYVRTENSVCASPACASVTVTVYPYPETPGLTGETTICVGESTMLTATGSLSVGSTIEWYTADGTALPALSGQMTPTVTPAVTTGYYARFENPYCEGLSSDVVTITVTQLPTTPISILHNAPFENRICFGQSVTLEVNGDGGPGATAYWYSGFGACGSTFLGTGPSITATPTANTNYFVKYTNSCGSSACVSITICVDHPADGPTSATATDDIICAGEEVTLTAIGGPGTYDNPEPCVGCPETYPVVAFLKWYSDCTGGTLLGEGTPLLVTPTQTTTYYAVWENGCGRSSCASVTVTVNKVTNPTELTSSAGDVICRGDETTLEVHFTLYPSYGTIKWYTGSCGGTSFTNATSTSIVVSPTVTTTYYARTENGTCYSDCASITVTVNNPVTPTSITTPATTICTLNRTITLTANGTSGGTGLVHWYVGSCESGTTHGVATGTTYTVTVPAAPTTTTYYAKMIDGDCYSTCASITITVTPENVMTSPITASDNPVCAGSSTTLEAHGSGVNLQWYSGSIPCGGDLLQTGGNLTVTPVITSRYFARYEGGACPSSACESITVTLSPLPTTPVITTPNTTICYGENITLNATAGPVGTTINWYSGSGECGSTFEGSGASLTVTPTLGTNVYFAQMESENCPPSACASVTITASANPETPTYVTESHNICYGTSTTLTATAPSGTTISWYTGSCGGTLVSSGSGPVYNITVSPTSTTKYWVRSESTSCDPSACVSVTVTVDPLPIDPVSIDLTAGDNPTCLNSSVTMTPHTPSNVGDVARWYTGSSACGGTLIAEVSGTGALTVTPTLTTIYYVTWNNDCGESACAQIMITVIDPPVAPSSASASPAAICVGSSSALSVTGGSGALLKWYTDAACLVPAIGTPSGTTFVVEPSPAGSYAYYARYESAPCTGSAAVSVVVTVNGTDPVPTISTLPATICTGDDQTIIAAFGTGSFGTGTLTWYKNACGVGTPIGTGTELHLYNVTETATYYVRSENPCGNSPCASVVITVVTLPAGPTAITSDLEICAGTSIPLTASGGGPGTLTWYIGSCGGTAIGTGGSITVSPTVETTYYAGYTNVCGSVCSPVTVYTTPVNVPPSSITTDAVDNTICKGSPVTLTAHGYSGGDLRWYTGSNPCGGTFIGSGPSITVYPALTSRYFARTEGGLCPPSACVDVLVYVNDVPQTPTTISNPVTICSGTSTTLNATFVSGTGIVMKWYANECGVGQAIGTGTTITVSPTSTTVYYARTEAQGCTASACLSVTVTVSAEPEMPTGVTANTAICAGQTISLYASTTGAGNTVNWYTGSCGGTFVQTGSPLMVSPTSTTKYYVRSEAPGCGASECASVTVTVNPLPVAPTAITATNNPVCNGTPTTLTLEGGSGPGTGTWATWYNGSTACGGIFVATTTGSLTVAPTITTIYWANWSNACGATDCIPILITVSDVPQAPTTISGPVTICNGESTTLTAGYNSTGAGISLQWYAGQCGGTSIGSGSAITVNPSVTTTYYAREESAGCTASACKTVTVTVSDIPTTPTSIGATSTVICAGSPTTLTAGYTAGAGVAVKWYTGSCGGSYVGTGGSITVNPSGTTTYYARTESVSCPASACLSITITVYPVPSNVTTLSAAPSTICVGQSTTLTASGTLTTGATLNWYTGSCGGTLVAQTTVTTLAVTPNVTTTYYARWENPGCVSSACVSVTVTVTQLPTSPLIVASVNPVCEGHSTTLSATGGSGTTLEWYSGSIPCSGPLVATGLTLTVTPTITEIYSARWVNSCGVSPCDTIMVFLDQIPVAPTSITATATEICEGGSITMTANGGSGRYLKWYLGGCGNGTAVGTGLELTVTPAAGTYTYYARWENNCDPSACAMITLTVYPTPTAPVINATLTETCAGASTTLEAVGGGGTGATIYWYADNCGGTAIATGVTTLVVSPTVTTTYYARYANSVCMSDCASKTITVYAVPVAPVSASASPNKVCLGTSTVLTANGGSGVTLKWYTSSCGGTLVGTGNNLTVTPTATATYYARWETPACVSTCAQVLVNVVQPTVAPSSASVSASAICEGTTVQLIANGGSGGILKWYSASCGGTFVGNGTPLTVTPAAGVTTYYARWENSPCDPSACVSVTVTTYAVPVAPTSITANPSSLGAGQTTVLTANGGSGVTLNWYTSSCGGTLIGTGSPITVVVNNTTTYYARWENPVCVSECVSATVTVGSFNLTGVVKYDNQFNVALNGVHITLKQGTQTIGTATTATQIVGGIPTPGYYQFNLLNPGTYTMDVTYSGTWGGVNATDALVIEQFATDSLGNPLPGLKHDAGDVDINATVNATDALWVKMRTVNLVNYFLAGDWVFNNEPIVLAGNTTYNFEALCTGDVNASFIPSGTKEGSAIALVDDGTRYVTAGESFSMDILPSRSAEIGAMTLFMGYDQNLVEVESISSTLGEVQSKLDDGRLGIAWSSVKPTAVSETTPIITLTMRAKTNIDQPSQLFSIASGSEFANAAANRIDNLDLKMSKLATSSNAFSLTNYPNPFKNTTSIVYTMPEQGFVKLVITNMYGETIRTLVNGDANAGSYQVTVDASALNLTPGVYLYKIEVNGVTTNFSKINKMVFTR